jgi:hypothetical protein
LSLGELGPQQLRLGWPTALAIVVIAPVVAFAVLLLWLAPTLPTWDPDAISTWTLRAKSLYFSNGLDAQTLHASGAFAYPIYESMLQALDFLAIGGANDLVFHVQSAILLLAFIGAVAGVSYRVGAPFYAIWPILGLFLVTPQVSERALIPLADLTLDYFFAVAVLLLAWWLRTRTPWLLVASATLLAAAVATKREGLLLAVIALSGGLVFAVRLGRRAAWQVVIAAVCVGATFVPWRVWVATHGSAADLGNLTVSSLKPTASQLVPAARLMLVDTVGYHEWLLVVPIALLSMVAAVIYGASVDRLTAMLYGAVVLTTWTAFVAVWWLYPELNTGTTQEQPAARLAGAAVALSAALTPTMTATLLPIVRAETLRRFLGRRPIRVAGVGAAGATVIYLVGFLFVTFSAATPPPAAGANLNTASVIVEDYCLNGVFLVLHANEPAVDPRYRGAVPANYIAGVGLTCSQPPPGYVNVGFAGASDQVLVGVYPKFQPK